MDSSNEKRTVTLTWQEQHFVDELKSDFTLSAEPAQAPAMEAYMKSQFRFLGLKTPQRKAIFKKFKLGLSGMRIEALARALYEQPFREMHYAALDLLEWDLKHAPEERVVLYHELLQQHAWWDSIDWIASKLIGRHFKRYPHLRDEWIQHWLDSGALWQQRSCLIFQLAYKSQTDTDLLRALIAALKPNRDFFIQKAIGWALRQYARTDAQWVRKVVAEEQLTGLSRREALKHVGE